MRNGRADKKGEETCGYMQCWAWTIGRGGDMCDGGQKLRGCERVG